LAAEIRQGIGADVELIEGRGGVFDVVADGKLLFSKRAARRFPNAEEILRVLRARPGG
jgi:predicted Rdx family selenoprotein